MTLAEALISMWRQVLADEADVVELAGKNYSVRRTPRRRLRQVDFSYQGHELRALEQNTETQSRWAQLARSGKRVMQFLEEGRYIAVVVEGKITWYGGPRKTGRRNSRS